jgi:hypothetical protein
MSVIEFNKKIYIIRKWVESKQANLLFIIANSPVY